MKASSGKRKVDESIPDIESHVRGLLIGSGIGRKLPTPVDDIVTFSKLVKADGMNLLEYRENLKSRGLRIVGDWLNKIRGLIDYKEKIVYVAPGLHPSKEKFVTFHEVSHRILPWHEGFYNPHHYDTDITLSPSQDRGLDAEANIAASLIQFQVDRFRKDAKEFATGLASAELLSQNYETSRHSTFRRYVEDSDACCALLVTDLVDYDSRDGKAYVRLSYPLQSKTFTERYGYMEWPDYYYKGDGIFELVTDMPGEVIRRTAISAKSLTGMDEVWNVETTWNSFNHFVLLYRKLHLSLKKKVTAKANPETF